MERHTPGPWFLGLTCNDITDSDITITGDGVGMIATVPLRNLSGLYQKRLSEPRTVDQQLANARLMASAPDLLAACRELLDHYDEADDDLPPGIRAARDASRLRQAVLVRHLRLFLPRRFVGVMP